MMRMSMFRLRHTRVRHGAGGPLATARPQAPQATGIRTVGGAGVLPGASTGVEATICQLAPYQQGIVARIQCESSLRNQLLELGFTRGTRVEFVRRAPLGDPIDVKLRGYRLSLREREACAIVVAPEPLPLKPGRRLRFGRGHG
jgi:Fe2+ transport system protein FeoA